MDPAVNLNFRQRWRFCCHWLCRKRWWFWHDLLRQGWGFRQGRCRREHRLGERRGLRNADFLNLSLFGHEKRGCFGLFAALGFYRLLGDDFLERQFQKQLASIPEGDTLGSRSTNTNKSGRSDAAFSRMCRSLDVWTTIATPCWCSHRNATAKTDDDVSDEPAGAARIDVRLPLGKRARAAATKGHAHHR